MEDYIQDIKSLLEKEEVTYVEFLDELIKLERMHAVMILKIKMGLRNDIKGLTAEMETIWKIGEIANRIRVKIKKKLNE
jgi:hypothetical protein